MPIFDNLVKEGKPLTVRNGEMTRFFMPVEKCVDIVIDALQDGQMVSYGFMKVRLVQLKNWQTHLVTTKLLLVLKV